MFLIMLTNSIIFHASYMCTTTDGLLIKGSDAKVNESSLTGESMPVKIDGGRPFLLSGCTLVEGQAKYLVTAVGPYSEWGKIMMELDDDRPETPLQVFMGSSQFFLWIVFDRSSVFLCRVEMC
jgi:magnesium-transporting ATPase (P-type)